MLAYLFVAVGSAVGGMARYSLSGFVAARTGLVFPWGTMVVNATGCFAIGLFYAASGAAPALGHDPDIQHLLTYGVLGGYTTFSTFSLETLNLAREGEYRRAGANVVITLAICLAATWLGHGIGRML